MAARIEAPTSDMIADAAGRLADGGLVGMPTETVYGLAADGTNSAAVARVFAAKDRPRFNPLIAHVASLEMARQEGVLNDAAGALAEAFWPGPLTLVVPVAEGGAVVDLARAGLPSIALRLPAHPVAQDLISKVGRPLVAPSANRSGRLSPVTPQAVAEELGDRVELILDGGPCGVGLESTVVACLDCPLVVLRPGGIAHDDLEAVLGGPLARNTGVADAPQSPGQLLRHYAPEAVLRLGVTRPEQGEAYLGFGRLVPGVRADASLSPSGDLAEAAANLFAMLRQLDAGAARIAVAPIPETGLGEAINDRLRRAAER